VKKIYKKSLKYVVSMALACSLILTSTAGIMADPDVQTDINQQQSTASVTVQGNTTTNAAQTSAASDEEHLKKMDLVAENDFLALYIDKNEGSKTATSIAVKNKKSGKIWFSNPPDPNIDRIATTQINREKLSTQLNLYFISLTGQQQQLNNYSNSVKKGTYEIKDIQNGVRIEYMIGSKDRDENDIPQYISNKRFNNRFLKNLSEEDQELLQELYVQQEDGVWKWVRSNDENNQLMIEILEKLNYTKSDLERDNLENGQPTVTSEKVYAKVPLEYILDNDSIVVRIPINEIEFNEKLPIITMDVLEFFGAAYMDADGYAVLPDGSGTILKFKDGSKSIDMYDMRVYGNDYSIDTREKKTYLETPTMPVFGIKQGEDAMFAIIEEGDAIANIKAYKAGNSNSFNTAFASFNVTAKDNTMMGDGNYQVQNVNSYEDSPYKGDIKIRYNFMSGEDANYRGMAKFYREYLIRKYNMDKVIPKKDIPLIVETVGAVEKIKSFLGINYTGMEPLTTFKQAQSIVQELEDKGVNNIKLKYSGWFNGGMDQKVAINIKPEKVLGGKKGFKELIEYTDQKGIEFYPEVSFMTNYRADGFSIYKYAAKFIDQRFARAYKYDVVSQTAISFKYITSPRALPSMVNDFLSEYLKYNASGVALKDMGNELYSDFTKGKSVNRQDASRVVSEQIAKIQDKVKYVMIEGGNSYAAVNADVMINIPFSSSNLNISDEEIPFYQMVYHGLVEYAGEPLNLSSEYKKDILKSIEYGAAMYYQWTYADSSKLKDTDYDYIYSSNYKDWIEDAVKYYEVANEALKDLQDKAIVDNKTIAENVKQTVYEDGTSVIVNYNDVPVEVNGIKIEAENFTVIRGGN